jgi:hypothetical protein
MSLNEHCDKMKRDSKYIGRTSFFKYIGITILILSGMVILSMIISPELDKYFERNLINPYLNEPTYFSIQIVIDLIIAYIVAGKIGESIIDNNKEPFLTTFLGFLKLWFGILIVAMFSETIPRLIEYGIDFGFIGLSISMWLVMGGPLFLLIGAVQGGLTSWFIGKEIEKRK